MMKKLYPLYFSILLGILCCISFQNGFAASVDTVSIFSNAMQKSHKCVVILPESYKIQDNRFPVVYLLHGYSGGFSNWIQRVPQLKNYSDEFQLIIICPDGDYAGWYLNSPIDSGMMYDTYISNEVPQYVDSSYRTINDSKSRAITGLSMGGHGALYLAWRNNSIYGAAGSMSGAVDLVPFKSKYKLPEILGDTANSEVFNAYSVVTIVRNKINNVPVLMISCGVEDPFINANRKLNEELLQMKIPHTYVEKEGKHNWDFWRDDIGYQLMFFHKYFRNNQAK
ncbi:MAG: alpha/beta hydrolase family protein [Ginsengibacter sp.]|jgi:S-formylglutathione hydrolase FrmB